MPIHVSITNRAWSLYLTAGDPNLETSREIALAAIDAAPT